MRTILLTMLLVATPVSAETLDGVGAVVDGDTITVAGRKVRLEGIDCPEAGQVCKREDGSEWRCGLAATEMTIRLADKRLVHCALSGNDRYHRALGTCYSITNPGVSINALLVRAGLARAFVKYSSVYVPDEEGAKAAKVGIWDGTHEAPWEYRARLRGHAHGPD